MAVSSTLSAGPETPARPSSRGLAAEAQALVVPTLHSALGSAAIPRVDAAAREAEHCARSSWRECRMPRLITRFAIASLACASGQPAAAQEPAAHPRPMQAQAHDPAECFCRAQGTTFAVGQTACLRTSEGPRI